MSYNSSRNRHCPQANVSGWFGCNILAWPNLPKSVHRLINPDGRVVEVEVICSVNMPSPREDVVVCGYGGRLNDAGGICGVR